MLLFLCLITGITGILMLGHYGLFLAVGHPKLISLNAAIVVELCAVSFRWEMNCWNWVPFCLINQISALVFIKYWVVNFGVARFCRSFCITSALTMNPTLWIGLQLSCMHVKPLAKQVCLTSKNMLGFNFIHLLLPNDDIFTLKFWNS